MMGKYSINDIERLSGIKAHTIRIWEKRYNIFQPERTDTNIRYYSDHTLRKILKISILNNNGVKISHIADLSEEDINRRVEEISLSLETYGFDNYIDALIIAMIELNEASFINVVETLSEKHDFEEITLKVIYPLFERIGLLWQIGSINPAQEHFMSNLIRQKLIVAIDQLTLPKKDAKAFLVFLNQHELHELGILFSYYILKKNGFKVIYLGQSVPYDDLLALKEAVSFEYMYTSFVSNMPNNGIQKYIDRLKKDFPGVHIFISGYQLDHQDLNLPSNVSRVADMNAFKEQIMKF